MTIIFHCGQCGNEEESVYSLLFDDSRGEYAEARCPECGVSSPHILIMDDEGVNEDKHEQLKQIMGIIEDVGVSRAKEALEDLRFNG